MNLEKLLQFLDTYGGRDKFIRLLSYYSKYASAITSSETSAQLNNFSSQLSACRAAFRLLDFVPAIAYAAQYGTGNKDESKCIRILNTVSNVIDVLFCPVDAVAWAIDRGIMSSKSTLWDDLSTGLWVASLFVNIIISVKKIEMIRSKKKELGPECRSRKSHGSEWANLSRSQTSLELRILKCTLDLIFAVHYLPPGMLWSGTLSKAQVGALGTVSSLISLHQGLQ